MSGVLKTNGGLHLWVEYPNGRKQPQYAEDGGFDDTFDDGLLPKAFRGQKICTKLRLPHTGDQLNCSKFDQPQKFVYLSIVSTIVNPAGKRSQQAELWVGGNQR